MNNLIKKIKENPFEEIDKLSVEKLEELILYAADKFFNTEKPIVSDAVYDLMIEFLQKKNKKSKILKKVGASIKNTKDRKKLDYWLGSMDKIKPGNKKINTWKEKYKGPYYLSDKLDGISALLTYKNKKIKLNTRGTATHGLDISGLIKYLNLPDYKKIYNYLKKNNIDGKVNDIALRGELLINKKIFNKNWAKEKKNTRNTVSGVVNSKVFDPLLSKDVELVIYEVVDPFNKFSNMMKIAKELGFKVVNYKKVNTFTQESLSAYLRERKKKSVYDIDGIIVTNNELHKRNIKDNPKYAFAFKDVLEDQMKETEVLSVDWKVSKDGKIIPTLNLKPIEIGGVTIKRVTAHNAKFLFDKVIGKGAKILLLRSGDVIPYIKKVLKPATSGKPDMPDYEWKWNKTKVDIVLKNKNNEMELRNLQYFFSTIGTKGLGPKVVKKFYNYNFKTVEAILNIRIVDIMEIDGFKEKSATNIVNSIKKSIQDIKLEKLMSASNKLGPGMGVRRIKLILDKYPNLLTDYKKWPKEEFIEKIKEIEGFDTITSTQFVENFKSFINFYKKVNKKVKIKKAEKKNSSKLENIKFVFTGFRNKDLQNIIESNGGKLSSSISGSITYLVVKDDESKNNGSSKLEKAKKLKIKIITLDELKKILISSFNINT